MIEMQIVGDTELILKLDSMGDRMKKQLENGMQIAMRDLQTYVKNDKLSGQVLSRRSGLLSSNINADIEIGTEKVTGSVGTNVVYARVHEYGGLVSIAAHTRTSIKGKVSTVKAHTALYPERSFLRSSLVDRRDIILQQLEESVKEVIIA